MPEMIRIALSVGTRESTLVEWTWADFGQCMGSAELLMSRSDARFGGSYRGGAMLVVYRDIVGV